MTASLPLAPYTVIDLTRARSGREDGKIV